MANLLVLHGPNLNLLGSREPEIYGYDTLDDINARLAALAGGHQIEFLQSNAEADLVNAVHSAKIDGVDCIVINPGAFTHTSIALRDAFLGVSIPFIEIHLSNVHAREAFRQTSYLSDIAVGVITGLGARGYEHALASAIAISEPGTIAQQESRG
jgi:3-dehydroquinate dehydratase-2